MPTPYDRALDAFSADLAREYLRIFRRSESITAEQREALTEAIKGRNKPAIRRIIGGADMRLEREIVDATQRIATRHLPAIAGDSGARAALSGMVQSATKALVAGTASGIGIIVDVGATRARYKPWHLLSAIGLTDRQARLYFATIRAAQEIADSIPRNAKTADAIQAAARDAAKGLKPTVARHLGPILRDPTNTATANATIRALSDRLRAHHAGPAAHVAAHSLIEAARLQEVLAGIAGRTLSPAMRKRWTNPLDELTRDSHAEATVANQSVPVDQPFETPWGPLDSPPPPGAHAYHCRCRAEYFIPQRKNR